MKFEKGHSKVGGRTPGTPNKRSQALAEILEARNMDVTATLVSEVLPKLQPADQAKVLLELMQYIYPKRKAIEHSGPGGEPIEINNDPAGTSRLKQEIEERKAKILQLMAEKKK